MGAPAAVGAHTGVAAARAAPPARAGVRRRLAAQRGGRRGRRSYRLGPQRSCCNAPRTSSPAAPRQPREDARPRSRCHPTSPSWTGSRARHRRAWPSSARPSRVSCRRACRPCRRTLRARCVQERDRLVAQRIDGGRAADRADRHPADRQHRADQPASRCTRCVTLNPEQIGVDRAGQAAGLIMAAGRSCWRSSWRSRGGRACSARYANCAGGPRAGRGRARVPAATARLRRVGRARSARSTRTAADPGAQRR